MAALKTCFKCHATLPIDAFYAHPMMADGHLGKCKECSKAYVRKWYADTRETRSAYEAKRNKDPNRREKSIEYTRRRRARDPEKTKAHRAVRYAILVGKLIRKPCEVCGSERVEGHHDDYSKPLEVRWLCFKHHREHGHGQTVVSDFER